LLLLRALLVNAVRARRKRKQKRRRARLAEEPPFRRYYANSIAHLL